MQLEHGTADDELQSFGASSKAATYLFNFLVSGVVPPPPEEGQKVVHTIQMGRPQDQVFDDLQKTLELMKTLNQCKVDRRAANKIVQDKQEILNEVEKQHRKVKSDLALLIDEGQSYLDSAKTIAATASGRTATPVAAAAERGFASEMVSTDTLEMADDY